MPKKLILSIIVLLIITNIATLLLWKKDKKVLIDGDRAISIGEPVALVGKEEISYKDWQDSLRAYYGKDYLKDMIDHSVVNQLAEEENIVIDEKIIERDLSLLISMQGIMSDEELADRKKEWRQAILHRYKLEGLLIKDHVTDEETRAHYDKYQNQYDFTETMQLSHIIVDTFSEADQVIKELDEGADFNLLAQEYSNDEETVDRGGYLGFITRTSTLIDEQYFTFADEMEKNTYSNPFQTNGGVAIFYVHLKLPSITFTYDELQSYIKTELSLNEFEQPVVVDPLWDELIIEWIYE